MVVLGSRRVSRYVRRTLDGNRPAVRAFPLLSAPTPAAEPPSGIAQRVERAPARRIRRTLDDSPQRALPADRPRRVRATLD